jgi:hypothetical protein
LVGIADYKSTLSAAFVGLGHVTDIVRIPRFDPAGLAAACEVFRGRLSEFDLGLVQHEWGFFGSNFRQQALCLTELSKSLRDEPPVAIFIHSGLPVLPRSRTIPFFSKNAKVRAAKRAMVSAINRRARVFTHGDTAREQLVGYGVRRDRKSTSRATVCTSEPRGRMRCGCHRSPVEAPVRPYSPH